MTNNDTPPPLYVPTRTECNAEKSRMRLELQAAGLGMNWNLDNMTCSHGQHIENATPCRCGAAAADGPCVCDNTEPPELAPFDPVQWP